MAANDREGAGYRVATVRRSRVFACRGGMTADAPRETLAGPRRGRSGASVRGERRGDGPASLRRRPVATEVMAFRPLRPRLFSIRVALTADAAHELRRNTEDEVIRCVREQPRTEPVLPRATCARHHGDSAMQRADTAERAWHPAFAYSVCGTNARVYREDRSPAVKLARAVRVAWPVENLTRDSNIARLPR